MKLLFFLLCSATAAYAQVQSNSGLFNVSSPAPGAPYVASRVLPCVYTVASNANSENLQLSISLNNGIKSTIINPSADISQGYSFQKDIGGSTVYEHQFNYLIPNTTSAGLYRVTFTNSIGQNNLTVFINISAAPPTLSVVTPTISGSSMPTHSSSAPTALKSSSAGKTLDISMGLFFVAVFISFVHF
ncbi:hypothetical protein BY458DRAFT_432171 [Sporodiniella umbellata]|nr:hypothetical protein BY458DRAFT_432171 [Sporodiniella umbellata]